MNRFERSKLSEESSVTSSNDMTWLTSKGTGVVQKTSQKAISRVLFVLKGCFDLIFAEELLIETEIVSNLDYNEMGLGSGDEVKWA
ncbi:hypothetical protein BPAE_0028g00780 [Botrytis paeoniae]|uniref:Uncharacterized protein n=1 Tax=Botrytis paeoniae TaxID=278948 RepID=A0A4Z1FZX6_9HELO|nr:hypothetical protein BPAE_0028g00780 [Botrytis paeoniae]